MPRGAASTPDGTLEDHVRAVTERPKFDINWFSDGGLTANLPVQFFDSPLPSRPDVRHRPSRLQRRAPAKRRMSRKTATCPSQPGWAAPPHGALEARTHVTAALLRGSLAADCPHLGRRSITGHARLPRPGGHGLQGGKEGGLNLSMPADVVDRLSTRGRFAAQRLVHRFGPDGERLDKPSLGPVPCRHCRPQRLVRRVSRRATAHRPTPRTTRS